MELNTQKREQLGKKTKVLREQGLIPAAVFGKGMETVSVTVGLLDFKRTYEKTGDTELIDINVAGGGDAEGKGDVSYKCLVKEVQYNPITDEVDHVGFYKPDLTVRTNADIPVEIEGEEENELVKSGEGLVLALVDTIEVSALPMDLPHAFTVDASGLGEIGEGITVADLNYDREKVEIVGLEEDALVVKMDYAEMAEEEEEEISEEEALAGIEATEETAAEDGEEGGEGSESGASGESGKEAEKSGGEEATE